MIRRLLPIVDGDGHPLCVTCGEHVCVGCPAGHRYRPRLSYGVGGWWVHAHRGRCSW